MAPREPNQLKTLAAAILATLGTLSLASCRAPSDALTFSTWGSVEEVETVKGLLKTFEKRHPEVKVELVHIPDNYFQKLHVLLAAHQAPDVIFLNNLQLPVYAASGELMPLEERLGGEKRAFFPASLQAMTYGKSLYAVPRDVSTMVLFYNRPMFQRAHVPEPHPGWTWSEFTAAARALGADSDGDGKRDVWGVSFDKRLLFWLPYVWSFGGTVLNEQGGVSLDAPASIEGLSAYARLRKDGLAPSEQDVGRTPMAQLFSQGRLAMFLSGRWSVPAFRKGLPFDWDVAPFPSGPAGSIVDADASGWAVSRACKRKDDAWKLVSFLSGPEASQAFSASGLILPARRDTAESPDFLAGKPAHSKVFFDVLATAKPTRTHPLWGELSGELDQGLDPLWRQEADAATAAAHTAKRLREVLGQ